MKHYIDATGEEWLRQFVAIRDAFLERMSSTAEMYGITSFRICGDDAKPRDLQSAIEYATYMIDDGFSFAFTVAQVQKGGAMEMWLAEWEEPQAAPRWPTFSAVEHEERHDGMFRVPPGSASGG